MILNKCRKGEQKDRDQLNRWIENSLVYIVNKRKYDQDPNKVRHILKLC